jgi:thiamine pyrophosphate-dependent acetolactate synthase large subunit-like protein
MKDTLLKLSRMLFSDVTRLPIGLTEFNVWADSIIKLSGLPNNDSMKFALSNVVMQLKPDQAYVSKEYLANILIKGAANEIAAQVFMDLKKKQAEAAEEAKKLLEAQKEESVSNESSIQVI